MPISVNRVSTYPDWPRNAVVQYTNAELRQVVRYAHGLNLLAPLDAKEWRMMAYGILQERQRAN